MATVETTPIVKDYLGHACKLAAAIDRFAEPLSESKREDDARALAQRIGRMLSETHERCEHTRDALELAANLSDRSTDDMQLVALLTMAKAYQRETCDRMFDLAGRVLDALQRADFVKPSQAQEAAHA